MDKTELVDKVKHLFLLTKHDVQTSVSINNREIDVRATETQGLVRKIILIECADYSAPVGVDKLQFDVRKLDAAKEVLKDRAVLMHVCEHGYTKDAYGYANERGIDVFTYENLVSRLINFNDYVRVVEEDTARPIILKEYQPTLVHDDGASVATARPALNFLLTWLSSSSQWLTVLGDYGVGKSWMLKRMLYALMDKYKESPTESYLPFFIPLQDFPKAFDYENLILKTFTRYGLSGVHYDAFQYLTRNGKIVFLLDSFDEMAQKLSRTVIRDNMRELLYGLSGGSKVIMTSRPNYFEGKSERLLVLETISSRLGNPLDEEYLRLQAVVSREIKVKLSSTGFARLRDLTPAQCQALFSSVLADNPVARQKLLDLFQRFQQLENLSQRAVIARLLITVAETLAQTTITTSDPDSAAVLPEIKNLNEGTIFQIVVNNLLTRDQLSELLASQRLRFLRDLAVFLQRPAGSFFATPVELRSIVERTFAEELDRSDAREQTFEEYYRSCRRHAGLTTLQQFNDTSGRIDLPVDDADPDAPIGFSHNSLREFLVANAIADRISTGDCRFTDTIRLTPAIVGFVWDLAENDPVIEGMLSKRYLEAKHTDEKALLFEILLERVKRDKDNGPRVLGKPPRLAELLLSDVDLSGINFADALFEDCILENVKLDEANLRRSSFADTILLNVSLDETVLDGADFRRAEIQSIYVNDNFGRKTTAMLRGREARQWLFSNGAVVHPTDDLNIYMGRNWYEAAKEVAATLSRRIAGTTQQASLVKGTKLADRHIAIDFVEYLTRKNVLAVKKRDTRGVIVSLRPEFRAVITDFGINGVIAPVLEDFFRPYVKNLGVGQ